MGHTMSWLFLITGLGVGIGLHWAYYHYAPGAPLGPYEQAVVRRGGVDGLIDGPAWLKVIDKLNLVGIYDVSDKRQTIHIEPAYSPLAKPEPGGLSRQRFYMDLVVIYRPTNMMRIMSLGDDFPTWLESVVVSTVRAVAFTRTWDELDDGSIYADHVESKLGKEQVARGFEVLDVYVERIQVRSPGEISTQAMANRAQALGRNGLILTYIEALETLANSENSTIVVPMELSGNLDRMLPAAT